MMRFVFIGAVLGLLYLNVSSFSIFGGPIHASCKVDWTWPNQPCKVVQTAIVNQIQTWSTDDNCKNGGEKCLYKLISQTDSTIKATHETPVKHYVDDLTFTFTQSGSDCKVHV